MVWAGLPGWLVDCPAGRQHHQWGVGEAEQRLGVDWEEGGQLEVGPRRFPQHQGQGPGSEEEAERGGQQLLEAGGQQGEDGEDVEAEGHRPQVWSGALEWEEKVQVG